MSIPFWKLWRKSLSSSKSCQLVRQAPKRSLRRRRLELERLEDRVVPSLTLLSSYTGLDSAGVGGGGEPPDTQGAAGPSSVVETVNQGVGIYTPKNTGSTPTIDTLADFYFNKGGLPHLAVATGDLEEQTDPFTIYDSQVQRFIVGDLDFETDSSGNLVNNGKNALLLAVSKSNNPTSLTSSDWYFYEVSTSESGVALQDYTGNPGYNADALVVTLNPFDSSGTPVGHSLVNAISINALINGTPLTSGTNLFQTDYTGEFLMRPATMPDSGPGSPMWMVVAAGGGAFSGAANTIDVVKMTNVLSASPNFSVTTLTVNPYYMSVNAKDPSGSAIDSVADSRMLQAAEQNGLLVATHEVSDAAGDLDDARWYAIDVSSGTPVLQQEGDVSGGPGIYDTYPGISINPQGDIGLTYMQSGTAAGQYESMYITGRTPSDPAGTMETPILAQAGTANYNGTRQGDMSRVAVDPDGSFWAFSEWANNESAPNWGTAIANFSLAPPISIDLTNTVEGQPLVNVPVATFLDASGVPLSSYTATIDWGDGTVTNGTVVPVGTDTFDILGTHTYINAGQYTLTVSVNNGITTIGPVSGLVNVADAPLTGSAQAITTSAGNFVSHALVGIFTDTDPTLRPASNYSATILWNEGDGLSITSVGTITPLGGNTFAVYGSSPYSFPFGGLLPVQVVVRDLIGGATVTINSVVNVANNQAIPPLIPQYQSDVGPLNIQYVSMEDALTNLLHSEQLLLVAFDFGTPSQMLAAFNNLVNAFLAYETAVFDYDMQLPGA